MVQRWANTFLPGQVQEQLVLGGETPVKDLDTHTYLL